MDQNILFTLAQIQILNDTPFEQQLTPLQLQRFNDLIANDGISAYEIVESMRKYNVSRNELLALRSKLNIYFSVLAADHEKAWQAIQPQITTPSLLAISTLDEFIREWEGIRASEDFDGPHIQDAREEKQKMRASMNAENIQIETNEWNDVIGNPGYSNDFAKIQAIAKHIQKWKTQEIDTHVNETDEMIWETIRTIGPNSENFVAAIDKYRETFANGAHINEANQTSNNYSLWKEISESRDISKVDAFVKTYPNSPLCQAANKLLTDLKNEKIAQMRDKMDEYPTTDLLQFIKDEIFTNEELIAAGVATKNSLNYLKNSDTVKANLPDLADVQASCNTSCAEGRTDIYLFGTPSTGKTCILMGLIGADSLDPDFAQGAGEYASALDLYRRDGVLPGQTKENFVATVQATITKGKNRHFINLVELAGEDFATKVAKAQQKNSDNVPTIKFEDMGDGVPELLANDNRKVFFLIVDPTSKTLKSTKTDEVKDYNGNVIDTKTQTYTINQYSSLKTMIDMLKTSENDEVMKNVEAVHIIVTKSDKLGVTNEERDENAYELFMKQYKKLIQPLTELCRDKGINQHPDKQLNGAPRLFTFSLGEFYPGGYFEYNDVDAGKLRDTISKCTQGVRPKTLFDRFCDMMNTPII